jgi:Ca2+-transporting ATPase
MGIRLMTIAPVIAIGSFLLFEAESGDAVRARTFALTALVIFQWFNALNCRSEEKSIFRMNPFSNKFLLATLLGVASLHVFAVYNPFMNSILGITPLSLADWGLIILVSSSVVVVEEIRKFIARAISHRNNVLLSDARS